MSITIDSVKNDLMKILKCENTENLKKCYYKQALEYHPDRNKEGEEMFKKIQNAYDILKDEEKLRKEYERRLEEDENKNITLKKISKIVSFLNENNCEYEDEKPLEYYENIMKNIYDKIFYLLSYEWELNCKNRLNRHIFNLLISDIDELKLSLIKLYGVNPYQLNVQKMYNLAFFIHITEERLCTPKRLTNNELMDIYNFYRYYIDKNPPWEILI